LQGGGLYNSGGVVTVTNSTFSNNLSIDTSEGQNAAECGGAIYSDLNGVLIIEDSTFTGNNSDFEGGAICADGDATISGSTFTNNETYGEDGGAVVSYGPLSISTSTFDGNASSDGGGGVYTNGAPSTIRESTFTANYSGSGGGVHSNSANLTITNSTFYANVAIN